MTENEFVNLYWKQYIMLEKEFRKTVKYVALDSINFETYSDAYVKLLIQIGSEVDIVSKALCKEINTASNAHNISQYQPEIISKFPDFYDVIVRSEVTDLKPWDSWRQQLSPFWWGKYNAVKHNRNDKEDGVKENYKYANLQNTINALAGLYQMEMYLYSVILHKPSVETPLPGSRLFTLDKCGWETMHFGTDSLTYGKDGCLYFEDAFGARNRQCHSGIPSRCSSRNHLAVQTGVVGAAAEGRARAAR